MDSITSAINKSIYDSIVTYTNSLIQNGLLNCDFDTAISHFTTNVTTKKKKAKPDVIKSLPMWTPHHFDTCIALVGDCMAQCSLSKTQGQFCTACAKKCGDDGIPPNGTIFTRTSYQYTAPNGKSPKPFIESAAYKKKIKEGESPAQIKQYYDDLHFDISPLNWGISLDPLSDHDLKTASKSAAKSAAKSDDDSNDDSNDEDKPVKKPAAKSAAKPAAKPAAKSDDSDEEKKPAKKPAVKTVAKTSVKTALKTSSKTDDDELTSELPDIPNSVEWTFQGNDYLAVNLPGGDKNIYDPVSHEHVGIFNSRSNRLIRY
jgi:hypothetical protein